MVQNNVLFFLFLAPYARTTRYEEAFLPKGKTASVASLSRPCLIMIILHSKQINRVDYTGLIICGHKRATYYFVVSTLMLGVSHAIQNKKL